MIKMGTLLNVSSKCLSESSINLKFGFEQMQTYCQCNLKQLVVPNCET